MKPANLFLAEIGGNRTLKVLDFGIAKVLSTVSSITQALSETGASVKAFTPQYGAPEQFHRRFGATGPWTDVSARGPDEREYPWGNDAPSCEHANFARNAGQGCGRPKGTQDVGLLPAGAGPFGALDLAGNAREWVADGWDPNSYAKGSQTDPKVAANGEKAVLRGGSWDYAASTAKTTFRLPFDRTAGDAATGFRCARSAE